MRWLSRSWAPLSTDHKAAWLLQALQQNITCYHAYMAYNLERFARGKYPQKYPYDGSPLGNDVWNRQRVFNHHQRPVWLGWLTTYSTTWGIVWHETAGMSDPPKASNISHIHTHPYAYYGETDELVHEPGYYWFQAYAFNAVGDALEAPSRVIQLFRPR